MLSACVATAEQIRVRLDERSYGIHIDANGWRPVQEEVARLKREQRPTVAITDENVHRIYGPIIDAVFGQDSVCIVAAGERSKSLATFASVVEFLAARDFSRRGAIFAVGGGVVGDLTGFVAATWRQGVDWYQVPTTLLAMADSSVGGKTGINLSYGKNLVGAFHQPRAVFVLMEFIRTLPQREFTASIAEIVRCGLLADERLFARFETVPLEPHSDDLGVVIRRACEIKAAIVAADEREVAVVGGRALLNLGHTFAHAIEAVTAYRTYLHGEAVAIGLHAAALLSRELGYLGAAEVGRIRGCLERHGLPVRLEFPLALNALREAMRRDKKAIGAELRFIVLRRIGDAAIASGVPDSIVESCCRGIGAH